MERVLFFFTTEYYKKKRSLIKSKEYSIYLMKKKEQFEYSMDVRLFTFFFTARIDFWIIVKKSTTSDR